MGGESGPLESDLSTNPLEEGLRHQVRLLDLSNNAIILRDEADRIFYWNKGCSRASGTANSR